MLGRVDGFDEDRRVTLGYGSSEAYGVGLDSPTLLVRTTCRLLIVTPTTG